MQRKDKGQLSVVWTWFTIVVVALSYSDISQLCRAKWKETMNMAKTNYVEQNEKKQWTWQNKLEIQSGQNRESWICFILTFFTREFCYNRYPKSPALQSSFGGTFIQNFSLGSEELPYSICPNPAFKKGARCLFFT